jgi:hypothetical protein
MWDVAVFTKNRDRLLEGEVAQAFFKQVLAQAREAKLLSSEHFTVDGTLIEAWASHKSFKPNAVQLGVAGLTFSVPFETGDWVALLRDTEKAAFLRSERSERLEGRGPPAGMRA